MRSVDRAILHLAVIGLLCISLPSGARATEDIPIGAPGQAIVEFESGVVNLPVDPGAKSIPLAEVPFDLPGLARGLENLGITEFEILAPFWRRVEPPPPPEGDFVPSHLFSFRDVYVLHFSRVLDLVMMLEALRRLPGIRLVTPNALMTLETPGYWPTDTLLSCSPGCDRPYQWNLENTGEEIAGVECTEGVDIGLRGAYEIQPKCTVKIGFADTGCDPAHEDLTDNIDTQLAQDFTSNDPGDWVDRDGHGTNTAGILGALHSPSGTGVAGICGYREPDSTVLVPLKVWPDGSTSANAVASCLIDALDYVASLDNRVPIVVLEVALWAGGSQGLSTQNVALLRNAVHNSFLGGEFLPAAGGNEPQGMYGTYPVGFRHMTIGVTAVGCDSSREGSYCKSRWIDIAAPSSADKPNGDHGISQIVTTKLGGGYTGIGDSVFYGGTSAATPHVGGAAGLLLSHTFAMTNEDLGELLMRTARDMGNSGYDSTYGYGLLRADSALAQLDRFAFVQDSTDQMDSNTQVATKRVQYFKNIQVVAPTIFTPNFMNETYTEVRADVFEFETTVPLTANTNAGHVPMIWARGRQSIAARDTVRYDGYFEPYTAHVDDVTSDEAVLRGYTYHLFSTDCSKSYGWFPLKLPLTGTKTVFSFSYLADTTSGESPRPRSTNESLHLQGKTTFCALRGKPASVRFWASRGETTTMTICDVTGRRVALLASPAPERSGSCELAWDGSDAGRRPVPAGVYYGRVRQGDLTARVSFLVVR
jgi:hypothetical protein